MQSGRNVNPGAYMIMPAYRPLTQILILAMVVAVGLPRLHLGASAQVNAPRAAPVLIEEVERLVSRHFYDRDAVERIWSKARVSISEQEWAT